MKFCVILIVLGLCLAQTQAQENEFFFGDTGIPEDYDKTLYSFEKNIPNFKQIAESLPKNYAAPITPARDQGECGSCWAFVCVGVLESRVKATLHTNSDLSEQQQISCNTNMRACKGGSGRALRFWEDQGPMEEDCTGYPSIKPIEGFTPPCNDLNGCNELGLRTYNYQTFDTSNLNDIKYTIYNNGPAYFRFNLHRDFTFFWYSAPSGGVYSYNGTSKKTADHAVLIYGWNDSKKAWLCKNSWGSGGPNNDGTFWITYSDNEILKYGVTNMEVEVAIPVPLHTKDTDLGSINSNNKVGWGGNGQWMADVNGDGKADYIYNKRNTSEYWVMLSDGNQFGTDTKWGTLQSGNSVGWNGDAQWLADVNGDGKADFIYNKKDSTEYWVMLSEETKFGTDTKWGTLQSGNSVGWNGDAQWLADVNGDSKADFIYNKKDSTEYWVMLSEETKFGTDTKWGTLQSGNNVGWNGDAQWLADVNGDGKADFMYNKKDTYEYWVMLSEETKFGTDTKWGTIFNSVGWKGKGQWLADFNGDGRADFMYNKKDSNEYRIMLSAKSNRFTRDFPWAGIKDGNYVGWGGKGQWIVDMNGDGRTDYIYNKANSSEYRGILSVTEDNA